MWLIRQTYIAGESFAGQYIPYFADAILKTNKLPHVNLKGIVMGNGWIDPQTQYKGYADFAYEKGLIKKGTPVGLLETQGRADPCRKQSGWTT